MRHFNKIILLTLPLFFLFPHPTFAVNTACMKIYNTGEMSCVRQYLTRDCISNTGDPYFYLSDYDTMDACNAELPKVQNAGWCGVQEESGKTFCYSELLEPDKCGAGGANSAHFNSYKECWAFENNNKSIPKFTALAQNLKASPPIPEIRLPFFNPNESIVSSTDPITGDTYLLIPWLPEYISALYKFGMVVASILAVVMLIQNGIKIIMSGGGEMKTAAYKRIAQVIIGLFLVWGSYVILYRINPSLVEFNVLKVQYIKALPLPEDEDNIEAAEYPSYVQKPAWDYTNFDCTKAESGQLAPAGVIPPSETVTYSCPGISGKITTIKDMQDPLCKVGAAAAQQGYALQINTGGSYRNFAQQVNGWCEDGAKKYPDASIRKKFRAVPGFSNHGHGRAVDIFLVKDKKILFSADSKAQCNVEPKLIEDLANLFYNTDANFNRLETEIWHFEYGTDGQQLRGKYKTKPNVCGK